MGIGPFRACLPPTTPSARFEKLDVDQNRRDPRHYDDSDLLPHRHEAPTPRQKGGPGTPGETTGPASPSKLTATIPLFPDLQLGVFCRTKIVGTMPRPRKINLEVGNSE